jgi:hypothetical protein
MQEFGFYYKKIFELIPRWDKYISVINVLGDYAGK